MNLREKILDHSLENIALRWHSNHPESVPAWERTAGGGAPGSKCRCYPGCPKTVLNRWDCSVGAQPLSHLGLWVLPESAISCARKRQEGLGCPSDFHFPNLLFCKVVWDWTCRALTTWVPDQCSDSGGMFLARRAMAPPTPGQEQCSAFLLVESAPRHSTCKDLCYSSLRNYYS